MKIHEITARKWTGQSDEIEATEPCPPGWVRCEIDPPQIGAEFVGRAIGWRSAPPPDDDLRKKRLEAAYHGIIADSTANLQSQTAWLAAAVKGLPCNPAKIGELTAWTQRAWDQYQVDKDGGAISPTFKEPQPPYSFIETMTPVPGP